MTESRRPRVLVGDDDRTATLLAEAALEQAGFEPVCVFDGAQAVERFRAGGIDLVVLDVEMPRMDGFAACAEIRRSPDGVHTPILMVTGREDVASIDRAFEVGANDFVTKPVAWIVFCQRIRYMLRASEAFSRLRESQRAAEAANDAKRLFLARASHELRTPLHAILGFAELIESALPAPAARPGDALPEAVEAVRTIRRSAGHLLRLVDDLLDLSRIEAGKLRVEVARFSVAELLGDLVVTLRPAAEAQRTELSANVHSDAAWFESDATRLRQILTNLVANAVQSTRDGRVEILAVPFERGGLCFEVRDTGVGMSPEQLEQAFEPFVQGESSAASGRAGLGLTVVRDLVQALGGALCATSEPGKGTTFHVRFPPLENARGARGGEPAPAAELAVLQGSRVLVIDDSPDNRRLLDLVLRKAGVRVTLACDGREALGVLSGGEAFDVVLMDLQMPHLDGYEATAELRRSGYTGTIVALTASALAGERERALALGFDGFLTKPIERAALLGALGAWIEKARAGG